MKAYSVILLFLCLNAAMAVTASLVASNVLVIGHTSEPPYTTGEASSQFSLFTFSASTVTAAILGSAGIVGLVGIMLRQGVYALYAVLIWVLGVFLNATSWILTGIGRFADLMLAGTGLESLGVILQGFVIVFFFFFLASVLTQRPDMT